MNRPYRFLLRMALFLAAVAAVAVLLYPKIERAFLVNPLLNGLIAGVIVIGIGLNVRTVVLLGLETRWLDAFRRGRPPLSESSRLRLLAPMASMLSEHRGDRDRFMLSTVASRSLLDSIASRLDESRDISRYFVGLCIFLGLLGTFWGLLETVASIGEVIGGLAITGDDIDRLFGDLKSGLEKPLAGMGTAFSSSLLGLSGSLVLGFLDLQASQAQNEFHNGLEDWLATQTRLSSGGPIGDGGDPSVPAYIQALLEQTADNLSELNRVIGRTEENHIAANTHMRMFADKVSVLTDQMRAQQMLLERLAGNQAEWRPVLEILATTQSSGGMDEATRAHIRNIDTALARMVEDTSGGRERLIKEVRSEIRLLARTIANLADEAERQV